MYGTNKKKAEAKEHEVRESLTSLIASHRGETVEMVDASELKYHPDSGYYRVNPADPVTLDTLADYGWENTPVIAVRDLHGIDDGTVIVGEERLLAAKQLGLALPVIWRVFPSLLEANWAHLVGGWRPVKRDQERLAAELALAYKMWEPLAAERMKAGRKAHPMGPQPIGSQKGATRDHVARYFRVGSKMVDASVWVVTEIGKLPQGDRVDCAMRKALRSGTSPMGVMLRFKAQNLPPTPPAPVSAVSVEFGDRAKSVLSTNALKATPAGADFATLGEAFQGREREITKGAALPESERKSFSLAQKAMTSLAMSNRAMKEVLRAHQANLDYAALALAAWTAARDTASSSPGLVRATAPAVDSATGTDD